MTKWQELRRAKLAREVNELGPLFGRAQRRWLNSAAPSLASREIAAVRRLLVKYAKR